MLIILNLLIIRQRKHKKNTKDDTHLHMAWEQDYHLQDPGRLALFDEYLEMSKKLYWININVQLN